MEVKRKIGLACILCLALLFTGCTGRGGEPDRTEPGTGIEEAADTAENGDHDGKAPDIKADAEAADSEKTGSETEDVLISDTQETDPAGSSPASDEKSGTESTDTENPGTGSADQLYKELLQKYVKAIDEKWDMDKCDAEQICCVGSIEEVSPDQIEYALEDINRDGQEELFIFGTKTPFGRYYKDNYVCGLYTVFEGSLVPLVTWWFGPREDGWYIYEDGYLRLHLAGTGLSLQCWSRLGEDGRLHVEANYIESYPPNEDPVFYFSDSDESLGEWFFDKEELFSEISKEQYDEYEKEYGKKVVADLHKYTIADFERINAAAGDAGQLAAGDEQIAEALSGYWYSFGNDTVFSGYDSEGNLIDEGSWPRKCVEFRDGKVYTYTGVKKDHYPKDRVGVDHIDSVEKNDDGSILIRIRDSLKPDRQYTYQWRKNEDGTEVMDFFGTWEEKEFSDCYSGTGSLMRRDDCPVPR